MAAYARRNGFMNLTDDQAKDVLLLINILSHVKFVERELTRCCFDDVDEKVHIRVFKQDQQIDC